MRERAMGRRGDEKRHDIRRDARRLNETRRDEGRDERRCTGWGEYY
jgi:hypothetical protein